MIYTDDFLRRQPILKELNILALSHAFVVDGHSVVEGNLVYDHPLSSVDDPFNGDFFEKRFNLFRLAENKKSIMEIGFNAGHSTLIMLLASPQAAFTLFDLNFHRYTEPCFLLLKRKFPDMSIEYGDSGVVIPEFIAAHPDAKFGLIHADGSHEFERAKTDFESSRKLSTKETVVVFDDTTPGNLIDGFLTEKVRQGTIKLVDRNVLGLKNTPLQTIFSFT